MDLWGSDASNVSMSSNTLFTNSPYGLPDAPFDDEGALMRSLEGLLGESMAPQSGGPSHVILPRQGHHSSRDSALSSMSREALEMLATTHLKQIVAEDDARRREQLQREQIILQQQQLINQLNQLTLSQQQQAVAMQAAAQQAQARADLPRHSAAGGGMVHTHVQDGVARGTYGHRVLALPDSDAGVYAPRHSGLNAGLGGGLRSGGGGGSGLSSSGDMGPMTALGVQQQQQWWAAGTMPPPPAGMPHASARHGGVALPSSDEYMYLNMNNARLSHEQLAYAQQTARMAQAQAGQQQHGAMAMGHGGRPLNPPSSRNTNNPNKIPGGTHPTQLRALALAAAAAAGNGLPTGEVSASRMPHHSHGSASKLSVVGGGSSTLTGTGVFLPLGTGVFLPPADDDDAAQQPAGGAGSGKGGVLQPGSATRRGSARAREGV